MTPAGTTPTGRGVSLAMRPSFLFTLTLAVVSTVACADDAATTTTPATAVVRGTVTAGPTCPVVQEGVDCSDRPVQGAVIELLDLQGVVVATATSDADGTYQLTGPAGTYTLEPQPVEGLMGTAAAVEVNLAPGSTEVIDLTYDTGIR